MRSKTLRRVRLTLLVIFLAALATSCAGRVASPGAINPSTFGGGGMRSQITPQDHSNYDQFLEKMDPGAVPHRMPDQPATHDDGLMEGKNELSPPTSYPTKPLEPLHRLDSAQARVDPAHEMPSFNTPSQKEDGNKLLPAKPKYRRAIGAEIGYHQLQWGQDVYSGLHLDRATTVGSVSDNCTNGAMQGTNTYLSWYRGIPTKRHSTIEQEEDNILNVPKNTRALILASHGTPGTSTGWNKNNAKRLGEKIAMLREKGTHIERIIFNSCGSAGGIEGKEFLKEVAIQTGAAVYAWTCLIQCGDRFHIPAADRSMPESFNPRLVVAKPIFEGDSEPTQRLPSSKGRVAPTHRTQLEGTL